MASRSVSDLRIVLIGKNGPENIQVENFIKSKAAAVFDSEASSHVQQTRFSEQERNITVFNLLNLFHPNLTQQQIRQTVSVCVSQCDPGPHVFILVLQYKDFSDQDKHRVKSVLSLFSQKAIEHTIVLTTDEETYTSSNTMRCNCTIHSLINECCGRHVGINKRNPGCHSKLFTEIEKVLIEGHEEFVICDIWKDGGDGTSVDGDPENSDQKWDKKNEKSTKRGSDGEVTSSRKAKLNFVLCGNNTTLKSSVSKLIRGTLNKHNIPGTLFQKDGSKECVKKEVKTNGRQISVVELPALNLLSEEEVMRETQRCMSMCDSGVDLFILVTPVTPLTDEDRTEMEKILRIFSSKENFMVLFISEHTVDQRVSEFVLEAESQRTVSVYGIHHNVMGLKDSRNATQVSKLLEYADSMKTEPYSLHTVIRVRCELEKKLKETDREIKDLQQKINTLESVKLKLVLFGNKALKSSISELILNESSRGSVISLICDEFKRTDVDLHGRLISLME